MAAEDLPEVELLARVIEELEQEEQKLSSERRELHHRIDTYADELALHREREVSAQRRELHKQIDRLRSYLRPFKRTTKP